MLNQRQYSGALRILVASACLFILIAGMRAAEVILVPLLLGGFIALLCSPMVTWLQGRGVSTSLAIALVIIVLLGVLSGLGLIIGSSLEDFYANLPEYQGRVQSEMTAVSSWLSQQGFPASREQILRYFDPAMFYGLVRNLLGGVGTFMTNGLLVALAAIFMLGEATNFPAKLRAAMGRHYNQEFVGTFTGSLQRYMILKTLIGLVKGVLITCWAALIGLDYALVWGFLAFLLNYVPNIGPTMAALPAIFLAFIDLGAWPAVYITLGYMIINIGIGDLLEPRIMGQGMGLSTLVVFLSLVIWAWVLGPVGMFLSVPLTMIIKIALDSYEDTRWLATLLGPGGHVPPGDSNPGV